MKDYAETPSLAAEAYSVVRQRILRGELVLGQTISRRKLAAELGMSFLPVSEALLRLEVEGLLESCPRAGTVTRRGRVCEAIGIAGEEKRSATSFDVSEAFVRTTSVV